MYVWSTAQVKSSHSLACFSNSRFEWMCVLDGRIDRCCQVFEDTCSVLLTRPTNQRTEQMSTLDNIHPSIIPSHSLRIWQSKPEREGVTWLVLYFKHSSTTQSLPFVTNYFLSHLVAHIILHAMPQTLSQQSPTPNQKCVFKTII